MRWINGVVERAAAQVPGSIIVGATPEVCVGGDAGGAPTPAKLDAMSDGVHVDDDGQRWWWAWVADQLPAQ